MNLFRRFIALFRKDKLDRDMAEEMRFHLEQRTEDHVANGLSPDEARYAALRKFGGVEQVKELAREQRAGVWLEQFGQDARYAARSLRKNPGFTFVTVLTLGLGIGATTAVFTLLNAMMLRELPVREPERLVLPRIIGGDTSVSYPAYTRFRDQTKSLEGLAAVQNNTARQEMIATDFGRTEAEPVETQSTSGNFFQVLGASALIGRTFGPEDDRPDATPVVVLSHSFWQRRFGGDASVVGKSIQVERVPFTVVGVMPPKFHGFQVGITPDLWWPMQMYPQLWPPASGGGSRLSNEGWEWMTMVGRLRPGVSFEIAGAEMHAIHQRELVDFAAARAARWSEQQRRQYFARKLELLSGSAGFTWLRERFGRSLRIGMVMVGATLLICCANVAGLLLARGVARQRELAVRTAIGAGRGRLVRQLTTESLTLAFLGGALGLLLAHWGTSILAGYLPPQGAALDLGLDGDVLAFAFGVSMLAGLLFGLVPALRAGQVDVTTAMKNQSAQAGSGGRLKLNYLLIVAQIALSVTLLTGAALFVRTLRNLKAVDLGFRPENVVSFSLEFGRSYDEARRADVNRRLLAALEAAPDVRSATLAAGGLLSGNYLGTRIQIDGYTPAGDEEMRVQFAVVGARYFETLGIPLVLGREMTPAEAAATPADRSLPRKVVIGESMARRYFGETNPLGRVIRLGLRNGSALEIIGVARDSRYRSVREPPPLQCYAPYVGEGMQGLSMTFYVRTAIDPAALAANVRALAVQIDPQVRVSQLRTLEQNIDDVLVQERMVAQLSGFFGLFAFTLASLGLYGLLSYAVVQRTREIGVRMALGARGRDVLRMVVGQGVTLAVAGVAIGIALALAATRLVSNLLYGVEPNDPTTFLAVAVSLVLVAALAAWLPARRAAKVDPMIALRAE